MQPQNYRATWSAAQMPALTQEILGGGEQGITVATSGSTGAPRQVALSAAALRHSARSSVAVLGSGPWISALPVDRVGGFLVWLRAGVTGAEPYVIAPGQVSARRLADAVTALGCAASASGEEYATNTRANIALVPTQLQRLVADPAAGEVLPHLQILLGGAAAGTQLVQVAQRLGAQVVRSYGLSETAAGCVLDGRALAQMQVKISSAGRVQISGPALADGYLGDPAATAESWQIADDGRRWFTTSDLGKLDANGRLTILGRADDVINTGAVKVSPQQVEATLTGWAGVHEACVVGVADAEWGQTVVAVLVPPDAGTPPLPQIRDRVSGLLNRASAPHHVLYRTELPVLPSGKVDRQAVQRWASSQLTGSTPAIPSPQTNPNESGA